MINFKQFLIESTDTAKLAEHINSQIWYHGNTYHGTIDEFDTNSRIFLSSSKEVAKIFAKTAEYVLYVDGEATVMDENEVRHITSIIEPHETVDFIVDWDNILDALSDDPDTTETLLEYINAYYNYKNIKTIKVTKPGAEVYELKVSVHNPSIKDYDGRLWGRINTNLDLDSNNSFKSGSDSFLGKNIQEGGDSSEIDFPIADTLVILNPSNIKVINKEIV